VLADKPWTLDPGPWTLNLNPAVPHCCWQALRSLQLLDTQQGQGHIAAAATLTQLTRLLLDTQANPALSSLSCLSALTGLQSLRLCRIKLAAPGLSLLAQGCSSLTQLELSNISMQPLPPGPPPPPQIPCSWPALLELQLDDMQPGMVSHLLPTPQAAPLLGRLPAAHVSVNTESRMPSSWPRDLQWASFALSAHSAEDRPAKIAQLAADVRCLAAFPVACALWRFVCITMTRRRQRKRR
jgi:hypothetical protein